MACRTASCVATPAGGWIAFLGVFAAMIWRRREAADFLALFGFGPKMGGFVVQKRNETPETPGTLETLETLSVDVRIVVL